MSEIHSYLAVWAQGTCIQDTWPQLDSWINPEDDQDESSDSGLTTAQDRLLYSNDSDTQQSGLLGGRIIPSIEPCYQYITLAAELETMVTMEPYKFSRDQTAIRRCWDARVATRFQGTSFADLAEYQRMNPLVQSRRWLYFLMYDFGAWLPIRNSLRSLTEICVEIEPGPGFIEPKSRNKPRFVNPDVGSSAPQQGPAGELPDMIEVIDGFFRGDVSLHYARWEWYSGSSQYGAEPMLELAYWIGPRPGVWNTEIDTQQNLGRYRDRRGSRHRVNALLRDRWVVIHLHFDATQQMFYLPQGHTYIGVSSISVYHSWDAVDAQRPVNPPPQGSHRAYDWYVGYQRGNGPEWGPRTFDDHSRSVIRCPYTSQTPPWNHANTVRLMMVGQGFSNADNGWPTDGTAAQNALEQYLQLVRDEGYLNSAGLAPIFDEQTRTYNQFSELSATGLRLNRPTTAAVAPLHQPPTEVDDLYTHPYGTNFRLRNYGLGFDDDGRPRVDYDFNIPMPAALPQWNEGGPPWNRPSELSAEDTVNGTVPGEEEAKETDLAV